MGSKDYYDDDDEFDTVEPKARSKDKRGKIGHNSGEAIGGIAAEALQQYIDRIERLEEEKKALADDIKQVKLEAKSTGFNVKILNKLLAIRKLDDNDRREQEELLDLYKRAIGMI